MQTIDQYLGNLVAGQCSIVKLYNNIIELRSLNQNKPQDNLDRARCHCYLVYFVGIGKKVYRGKELLELDNLSYCKSFEEIISEIEGKPTLNQYILILLKFRVPIRNFYGQNTNAIFIRSKGQKFCYKFVNPFGIYAEIKGPQYKMFNGALSIINFFLCNENKVFDPMMVIPGLFT